MLRLCPFSFLLFTAFPMGMSTMRCNLRRWPLGILHRRSQVRWGRGSYEADGALGEPFMTSVMVGLHQLWHWRLRDGSTFGTQNIIRNHGDVGCSYIKGWCCLVSVSKSLISPYSMGWAGLHFLSSSFALSKPWYCRHSATQKSW